VAGPRFSVEINDVDSNHVVVSLVRYFAHGGLLGESVERG
jgi:hypothetical protein